MYAMAINLNKVGMHTLGINWFLVALVSVLLFAVLAIKGKKHYGSALAMLLGVGLVLYVFTPLAQRVIS